MTTSDTGYVYTLSDPRTGDVKYVGSTVDPQQRLMGHLYDSPNEDLEAWKRELSEDGAEPRMTIISVVTDEPLRRREAELIDRLSSEWDLLNKKRPSVSVQRKTEAEREPELTEAEVERGPELTERDLGKLLCMADLAEQLAEQNRFDDALEHIKNVREEVSI